MSVKGQLISERASHGTRDHAASERQCLRDLLEAAAAVGVERSPLHVSRDISIQLTLQNVK